MLKVLFIPPSSGEISQMALIREELTKLNINISSIALNKTLTQLLRQANFEYKRIEDYHTQNTVKIIQREQPDLVYTNPISISPFMIAFTNAAAYLSIPCLQIYNGNIASPTTHGLISLPEKVAVFFKRVIGFCSSLNNFLSFVYLVKTVEATSNYIDAHNKLLRELLKLKNPYVESHRYREGTSLIVPTQPTKEIMIDLGWPEESVFVLGQSRLDLIFRQILNRD
ncbi:MAG: hypothetical protein A2158_06470 [Chloroflexi bacterium RBG_13_46_14]|nr:MAG: hypothetical protein A2158_06470 [Chloroflexi bacterium RBG_13_46_14]